MIIVDVNPVSQERIKSAVGPDELHLLRNASAEARGLIGTRTIWNINSTARGGGVAEMLQPLIAYARCLGIDVRWLVIDGNAEFFDVTKRIHNNIHGHVGDGGPVGSDERKTYEAALAANLTELSARVRDGDIVICHDPQTAGLLPALRSLHVVTVWRCHIGNDSRNELTDRAWAFLMPYLQAADRHVFSRREYIPGAIDPAQVDVIPPSIDPLSPKNQPLLPEVVRSILLTTGVLEGQAGQLEPCFSRENGSRARIRRLADIMRLGPAPRVDQPLIVQVSRWDHLKDPLGVMEGFSRHLKNKSPYLILAGPNVSAVADDPEGGRVLDEVIRAWRRLPHETRQRVDIVCLPMADREENAAIVNALQRQAAIVVQKSLHEGFGLTVTEAMWKGRPVVASAVGGIRDQIRDGIDGLLVKDPNDLPAFAAAIDRLLIDRSLAQVMMQNARKRVAEEFLFPRHLRQYLRLLWTVLS